MAEPLGALEEEEVPPLLTGSSGEESEEETYADVFRDHSGGPPLLISESSGGESGSPLWQPAASGLRGGFLAGGPAPARPHPQQAQQGQRRTLGSLDEIDQSDYGYRDEEDEDEDEWEPLYGGPGFAGVGGPAFPGGAAVLGALPGGAQLAGLGELQLNEGLLQQVPIQELLEAVLQGVGGGPLAGLLGAAGGGGGRGRSWGFGANGPRMFGAAALAVDASQIPAGLEGSARHHALTLAEQGFVTAMDPARHAACAAEGIPAGRQQVSSPLRRAAGAAAGAAPAAASRAGLQRADSAAAGGGLQRGDSAASQGLTPLARRQRAASSQQPGAALSRLASAQPGAEGGRAGSGPGAPAGGRLTAAGAAAAGSGDDDGPPELAEEPSSQSDSDFPPGTQANPALVQPSTAGSGSEGEPGSRTRRRSGSGADSGRQPGGAPPLQGRRRRNAIFGQLPGLGAGTSLAGMAGTPELPLPSDEEPAAGGLAIGVAPAAARGGEQGGEALAPRSDGHSPPPLENASDSSNAGLDGMRGACRTRSAAAAAARRRRLGGGSSSSSSSSGMSPLALLSGSDSEGSRENSRGARNAGDGMLAQRAPGSSNDGSSSDGGSSRSSRLPLLQDSDGSAGAPTTRRGRMLPGHVPSESGSGPPSLFSEERGSGSEGGGGRAGRGGSNAASSLPPMLMSEGNEGEPSPGWGSQLPDLASESTSGSSADDMPSPLRRRPGSAGSASERSYVVHGGPAPQPQPRRQAQGRPGFTADQRDVMQALTSLLPPQLDGAGWAELAAYVRPHRASARRGGSGGGVQLLSRLVAAAASQFPGEAEAAGLTERPLALPPAAAAAAPAGASAGSGGMASQEASVGPWVPTGEAGAQPHLQQYAQQQQQAPDAAPVVGSEGAAVELRQQPGGAAQAAAQAQLESEAIQHARPMQLQHTQQPQQEQPQTAGQGGPSTSAAGTGATPAEGAAAQLSGSAGSSNPPEAAAASAGVAALAALTASMRGAGSPRGSVASAEAALRLLALPGAAAAQHPLPPLVAAALAAARAPPPDQPEE